MNIPDRVPELLAKVAASPEDLRFTYLRNVQVGSLMRQALAMLIEYSGDVETAVEIAKTLLTSHAADLADGLRTMTALSATQDAEAATAAAVAARDTGES